MPNENNQLEVALSQVHDIILQEYHFEVEKQNHIHECVECIGNSDNGYWKISYWIKVKKGEEIFWTVLMTCQQDNEGSFHQIEGLTEVGYMDFFVK